MVFSNSNVDGVAICKSSPTVVGGILCHDIGQMLLSFSKSIGVKDSNEAEVLAILVALGFWMSLFHDPFIVDND